MAEGVFQSVTKKPPYKDLIRKVDSCGTGAYHVGDEPDERTMETLKQHGITDYDHAARKVRVISLKNPSLPLPLGPMCLAD